MAWYIAIWEVWQWNVLNHIHLHRDLLNYVYASEPSSPSPSPSSPSLQVTWACAFLLEYGGQRSTDRQAREHARPQRVQCIVLPLLCRAPRLFSLSIPFSSHFLLYLEPFEGLEILEHCKSCAHRKQQCMN